MSVSNPPDCPGIHFLKKKNLPSFEARNYAVKSVSQMMVMMIILIAERIVESMCAVSCMIAFYFWLPAKSLRTYLLSEATSSRCCVDCESKSTDVRARVRQVSKWSAGI